MGRKTPLRGALGPPGALRWGIAPPVGAVSGEKNGGTRPPVGGGGASLVWDCGLRRPVGRLVGAGLPRGAGVFVECHHGVCGGGDSLGGGGQCPDRDVGPSLFERLDRALEGLLACCHGFREGPHELGADVFFWEIQGSRPWLGVLSASLVSPRFSHGVAGGGGARFLLGPTRASAVGSASRVPPAFRGWPGLGRSFGCGPGRRYRRRGSRRWYWRGRWPGVRPRGPGGV